MFWVICIRLLCKAFIWQRLQQDIDFVMKIRAAKEVPRTYRSNSRSLFPAFVLACVDRLVHLLFMCLLGTYRTDSLVRVC
jgi:hypothetical protein